MQIDWDCTVKTKFVKKNYFKVKTQIVIFKCQEMFVSAQ